VAQTHKNLTEIHLEWLFESIKCSKSPGRQAADPTEGVYSAHTDPLADGEGNIASPRTPPLLARRASLFGAMSLAISVDGHNAVDGSAPMTYRILTMRFAVFPRTEALASITTITSDPRPVFEARPVFKARLLSVPKPT